MSIKSFVVFVVILVTLASIGLTSYYLSRDTETIVVNTREVYVNKGDRFEILIDRENPSKDTVFTYEIKDEDIVTEGSGYFTAIDEGTTEIKILVNKSGWVPVTCFVTVGGGSLENPFIISTVTQLTYIGDTTYAGNWGLDDNYKLVNDLDMTGVVWTPITTLGFSGVFDGSGFTISNMTISDNFANAGLFAQIANTGIVKNLNFDTAIISGQFTNVGIIAGENLGKITGCKIDNSSVNSIATFSVNVGAIVGKNGSNSLSAVINQVAVDGTSLSGLNDKIGGLCGINIGGEITYCYFNGIITSITSGGVSQVAGLISENTFGTNSNANVGDCYAVVNYNIDIETLKAGLIYKNIDSSSASNYLWGLYNDITVSGLDDNIVTGSNYYTSDFAVETAGLKTTNIFSHVADLGSGEQNYYWDFQTIWELGGIDTNGYPQLRFGATSKMLFNAIVDATCITNATMLANIANDLTNSYKLLNDITIPSGTEWTPIGNISNPFNGMLFGNGFTIYGLTISNVGNYNGLFGVLGDNAIIQDIIVTNVTITNGTNVGVICGGGSGSIIDVCVETGTGSGIDITTSNAVNIGGIAGTFQGSITGCESNISINISVTTDKQAHVGGIVGENNGTVGASSTSNVLKPSSSNATLEVVATNSYVGGLVGLNKKTISQSRADIVIIITATSSSAYAGGIVGANISGATIINSCATGDIIGYYVGGIAGYSNATIQQSYVSGITIKGKRVGGLIGDMELGNMENCYAIATLKGYDNSSVKSGFSAYVRGSTNWTGSGNTARITHCFVSTTFDSIGTNYAETESTIRQSYAGTNSSKNAGFIYQCIYDSSVAGNVKTQAGSFTNINGSNSGYYNGEYYDNLDGRNSTSSCKNGSTYSSRGFSGTIWNLNLSSSYPTLISAVSLN